MILVFLIFIAIIVVLVVKLSHGSSSAKKEPMAPPVVKGDLGKDLGLHTPTPVQQIVQNQIIDHQPVPVTPDQDLEGVVVFYSEPTTKEKIWICTGCGATNEDWMKFCTNCGHAKE